MSENVWAWAQGNPGIATDEGCSGVAPPEGNPNVVGNIASGNYKRHQPTFVSLHKMHPDESDITAKFGWSVAATLDEDGTLYAPAQATSKWYDLTSSFGYQYDWIMFESTGAVSDFHVYDYNEFAATSFDDRRGMTSAEYVDGTCAAEDIGITDYVNSLSWLGRDTSGYGKTYEIYKITWADFPAYNEDGDRRIVIRWIDSYGREGATDCGTVYPTTLWKLYMNGWERYDGEPSHMPENLIVGVGSALWGGNLPGGGSSGYRQVSNMEINTHTTNKYVWDWGEESAHANGSIRTHVSWEKEPMMGWRGTDANIPRGANNQTGWVGYHDGAQVTGPTNSSPAIFQALSTDYTSPDTEPYIYIYYPGGDCGTVFPPLGNGLTGIHDPPVPATLTDNGGGTNWRLLATSAIGRSAVSVYYTEDCMVNTGDFAVDYQTADDPAGTKYKTSGLQIRSTVTGDVPVCQWFPSPGGVRCPKVNGVCQSDDVVDYWTWVADGGGKNVLNTPTDDHGLHGYFSGDDDNVALTYGNLYGGFNSLDAWPTTPTNVWSFLLTFGWFAPAASSLTQQLRDTTNRASVYSKSSKTGDDSGWRAVGGGISTGQTTWEDSGDPDSDGADHDLLYGNNIAVSCFYRFTHVDPHPGSGTEPGIGTWNQRRCENCGRLKGWHFISKIFRP